MKFGLRTPNLKKSIKARTTGRIKRAAKRAINPVYGKKGMGYVNNPEKAIYNKIYNKTTVGIEDVINAGEILNNEDKTNEEKPKYQNYQIINNKIYVGNRFFTKKQLKVLGTTLITLSIILMILSIFILPVGIIFIIIGFLIFTIGKKELKEAKRMKEL